MLYLTARKGHKGVAFEEIKDALTKQICDNAYVISEIEALPQVYAFISILSVVVRQSLKDSQLDPRSVSVLLHCSDYFDGTFRL